LKIRNHARLEKLFAAFAIVAGTTLMGVTETLAGPFWIRVTGGGPATTATLGPTPPSDLTSDWSMPIDGLMYVTGFFDAPTGNPVEITVDDANTGARLANLSATLGPTQVYAYGALVIPHAWNRSTVVVQARTVVGATIYTSDTAHVSIFERPLPPKKPELGDGVGANAMAGLGAGAVTNLLGGGPVTLFGTAVSAGTWVGLSSLGAGVGSGLGTLIWNATIRAVDPDGPQPKRVLRGTITMIILGAVLLLIPLVSYYAARHRWRTAAIFFVLLGGALCALAYVPEVPLSLAPLFYAFPWIALALTALIAWVASLRPDRYSRLVLQVGAAMLIAGMNFGILATIVDYASAWLFLRFHELAVGVWFTLAVILVEHSISQRRPE
jgi:hypothetical protein